MAYQLSGNDEHFDGAADKYNRCCFLRSRWRGELGASAIAGIYYLAVYMLGFGFSIGLQVMIARRNGECGYGKAGKIFFQGFFFLSGLAILLCLLMQASSPFILGRLISSPEIYRAVIQYLDWRSFGLLFSFPFLVIRSFLVGITCTRALSWAAAVAVVINIPLNYILIFVGGLGISGLPLLLLWQRWVLW